MKLALADIRRDGGTQSRAELSAEAVTAYGDAMLAGTVFPAVVVFYDGQDYWLADGFHRVEGASAAGIDAIDADVRQGTRREAVLFSVGANASHGVQRTNADKHRAVELLVRDDEWGSWGDREIARACNVSHTFVARLRARNTPKTTTTGNVATNQSGIRPNGRSSVATVATAESEVRPTTAPPASSQPAVDNDLAIAAHAEELLERAVVLVVDACRRPRARVYLQTAVDASLKKLSRLAQENAA